MPPRTSTASAAARRAPSSSAVQKPTYEPLLNPLTPAAQAALHRLKQTHKLNDLEKSLKTASTQLSECAFEINESLANRENNVKKRKARAEAKGVELDGRYEEELDEFRVKTEKLTERMEEYIRKVCDAQQGSKDLEAALGTALVTTAAAGAQSQRRTQMQSFEPTMDGEEDLGPPPSEVFTKKVQLEREKYTSLPLGRRYAEHPEYVGFKQSVHEALHGDEVPMPPSSRWFRQEGSPVPGTAAAAAGEEDSDDDLAVQRATISTKCPITLRELEDPVTSKQCPHTFERSAILEMIGRRPAAQCPVPGCSKTISRAGLEANQVIIRKIRRIQQARRNTNDFDEDDDDAPRGQTADHSILLSSEAGGQYGFDPMDEDEIAPSTMKSEPRSTQPPPSRSSRRTQVVDLDDEEDGDETEDDEG